MKKLVHRQCPHDGGRCHHGCAVSCARMRMEASLTNPIPGFPLRGELPLPEMPPLTDAVLKLRTKQGIP